MVLEGVNDGDILMESLHYKYTTAGELHQAPSPALSMDAQICATQAVVVVARESSPQSSKLSTSKIFVEKNPRAR